MKVIYSNPTPIVQINPVPAPIEENHEELKIEKPSDKIAKEIIEFLPDEEKDKFPKVKKFFQKRLDNNRVFKFEEMCEDMQLNILEFLPPLEFANLGQINKKWHAFVQDPVFPYSSRLDYNLKRFHVRKLIALMPNAFFSFLKTEQLKKFSPRAQEYVFNELKRTTTLNNLIEKYKTGLFWNLMKYPKELIFSYINFLQDPRRSQEDKMTLLVSLNDFTFFVEGLTQVFNPFSPTEIEIMREAEVMTREDNDQNREQFVSRMRPIHEQLLNKTPRIKPLDIPERPVEAIAPERPIAEPDEVFGGHFPNFDLDDGAEFDDQSISERFYSHVRTGSKIVKMYVGVVAKGCGSYFLSDLIAKPLLSGTGIEGTYVSLARLSAQILTIAYFCYSDVEKIVRFLRVG